MKNLITGEQEDKIYAARKFIQELQKVQEDYFTKISADLGFEPEGDMDDWLFDYIFNDTSNNGFEEYLEAGGCKLAYGGES